MYLVHGLYLDTDLDRYLYKKWHAISTKYISLLFEKLQMIGKIV